MKLSKKPGSGQKNLWVQIMIETNINGKAYSFEPQPGEMLSSLLRERLGLTGTKIGCDEAECGACTVLIDGEPILSCSYPAAKIDGKEVITIEGLAKLYSQKTDTRTDHDNPNNLEHLHPLQQAFVKLGAVQCGFCIPGQIMTSFALLRKNPEPANMEIRQALKDTLCRCAGYPTIIRAVETAAQALKTGYPVREPNSLTEGAWA